MSDGYYIEGYQGRRESMPADYGFDIGSIIDEGIQQVTDIVTAPVESVAETVSDTVEVVAQPVTSVTEFATTAQPETQLADITVPDVMYRPPINLTYHEIMAIQKAYNQQGFSPRLKVDGLWGAETQVAYEMLGLPDLDFLPAVNDVTNDVTDETDIEPSPSNDITINKILPALMFFAV